MSVAVLRGMSRDSVLIVIGLSIACSGSETDTEKPSPSMTASSSRTTSPSPSMTQSVTPTASMTATSTASMTASPTASMTATPAPSITASQTLTPTPAPTPSRTSTVASTPSLDEDGDGFLMPEDCDDQSADIHPGAVEICGDGMDQDCDTFDSPCLFLAGNDDGEVAESMLLTGTQQGFEAGRPLALVGDITGDGIGDLVAGNVVFTTTASIIPGEPNPKAHYDFFEDGILIEGGFGMKIGEASAALDADGDGAQDLLVGAPGIGAAYLLYAPLLQLQSRVDLVGAPSGWSVFSLGEGAFGGSILGGVDLDQDGCEEVIIGAPDLSSVHLWQGRGDGCDGESFPGEVGPSEAQIVGEGGLGFAMTALKGTWGTALALGRPHGGDGGVSLFLGWVDGERNAAAATLFLEGEQAGSGAGYALATPGDIDGDGEDDLLVGAPFLSGIPCEGCGALERMGRVYLVPGHWLTSAQSGGATLRNLAESPWQWSGSQGGMHLGSALSFLGDFDGGGKNDLLIGADAHFEDTGCPPEGGAYIVPGETLNLGMNTLPGSGAYRIGGGQSCIRLGDPISGGGDFNGDGFPDIWVGSKVVENGDWAALFLGRIGGE